MRAPVCGVVRLGCLALHLGVVPVNLLRHAPSPRQPVSYGDKGVQSRATSSWREVSEARNLVPALRGPLSAVDDLLGVDLEACEVGGRHLYGTLQFIQLSSRPFRHRSPTSSAKVACAG